MDSLENLRKKIEGAEELKSVVRTMKALAASNIGQFHQAVLSLHDYYRTVTLGLIAYLSKHKNDSFTRMPEENRQENKIVYALVIGSDLGLVGPFNDLLIQFVEQSFEKIPGKKIIWAVGERIQLLLADKGYPSEKLFSAPNSVNAITPLISQLLLEGLNLQTEENKNEIYIFHNQPRHNAHYVPTCQRFLPLDAQWMQEFRKMKWPDRKKPEVIGKDQTTFSALIREYLFVSLFKSSVESLASENESRLNAMQRAEKNIEERLEEQNNTYHQLRQQDIDIELFDLVTGFEALKNKSTDYKY